MNDARKTKTQLIHELSDLRGTEARYRNFVENVEDACWELNLAGDIVFCNEAMWRRVGCSREEILTPGYRKRAMFPEDYEILQRNFREVYQTGLPQTGIKTRIHHKDGSLQNIEISISLIRDQDGNPTGFRGISRDVTEREKAEEEQIRFRTFLDNTEDCCFEIDLDGRYLYLNEAHQKILGYTIEELKAMTYKDFVKTNAASEVFGHMARTGEPVKDFVLEVLRKDGQTRIVEMSSTPIRDASGKIAGARGIVRDVTEREKTHEERKRFQEFLESVDDACFETDLQGHFTYVNEAECKTLGYSLAELHTIRFDDYSPPEEAKKVSRAFGRQFRTGEPIAALKHEIVRKDGQIRTLEVSATAIRDGSGKIIGTRGISRDVTEREKAYDERKRFQEFLENVTDGCWETDLNGRFLYANEAHCKSLGFSAEEMKHIRYKDFSSPEEAKKVFEVFRHMLQTGEPIIGLEREIIREDGQIRILETSATVVRDRSGRVAGFRGISRDMTERVKAREEQKRSQEFLETIDDACFEIDLKGRYTYSNEAHRKIFGYATGDLKHLHYEDYSTAEEKKRVDKAFERMFQTGQPIREFLREIVFKDGRITILELSATPIRDGSGKIIGARGISRDVTERKKAEAERERSRIFLENAQDSCWEIDLRGEFIYCNEATWRNLGYTREEYLDRTHRKQRLHPEDYEKVMETFNEVYQTGIPKADVVFRYLHKNGSVRHVEASINLMRDHDGKIVGFRGISRDITERVKAQEEQKRSQEFLENIEDCCYEMDLEGNYTYSNEAHRKLFGYTAGDLAKFRYEDYISDEDSKKTVTAFLNMYKTGEPIKDLVREVLTRDGRIRTMELSATPIRDKSGNITGGRGIARDVTERKKTEAEQERYRVFLENVADGCWELDMAGRVMFCNEAAARKLGYTREEYIQEPRDHRMPPDAHHEMAELFKEMYRTGLPITGKVFPYFHKDGATVFMEVSVSIIRDETGKAIGARGISRDVTERRKMEEQLSQSRKMEAIGTLAGGIAHDFNNLLMGIQGYTSLMLLDTDQYHPNYEKLKAIELQVQNAADLTRQLLGYAQGGRYEVKPTDMNALIDQTATMFGRTKRELSIHKRFTAGLWPVEVDRGQLEQSLLNIMINSWQAMPGGGSLYLETSNVTLDEAYVAAYDVPAGPYVKISVTDTGVGMDEQTRQRIFDPFFTTKGMGKGAGLGMASVYGIIRGHNGIINVYSERGRGTTFSIYLPSSRKEEKPALQSRRPAETAGKEKTILLVDDEKVITEVTGAMLRGLGYDVLIAGSGEEAVDLYSIHQDEIDLVIMDMIMPGMGGGTAIDRIHAINPEARIILSSGYSQNGEAQEILDRGGSRAFLQKPFLMGELSQKINEILTS